MRAVAPKPFFNWAPRILTAFYLALYIPNWIQNELPRHDVGNMLIASSPFMLLFLVLIGFWSQPNLFLYWTPRILSIGIILFLAVFSLDVFEEQRGIGRVVAGLLIHNIPSFILTFILIFSWKREHIIGILYFLAGLLFLYWGFTRPHSKLFVEWILMFPGYLFFVATLFGMGWFQKRNA